MVREDIVAALKNSLERGYSFEDTKQSLISAGYSTEEVEEASNFIHSGSVIVQKKASMPEPVTAVQPAKPVAYQRPMAPAQPTSQQTATVTQIKKPKKQSFLKGNLKIILLSIILVLLLAVFILTFIFRDKIISWFG